VYIYISYYLFFSWQGFSFASSQLLAAVPYDPHLPFLFFGEEVSMAARMFTRGWDIFAPTRHVLFHRWERHYRPTFWQIDGAAQLKFESQQRVRRLLTGESLTQTDVNHSEDGASGVNRSAETGGSGVVGAADLGGSGVNSGGSGVNRGSGGSGVNSGGSGVNRGSVGSSDLGSSRGLAAPVEGCPTVDGGTTPSSPHGPDACAAETTKSPGAAVGGAPKGELHCAEALEGLAAAARSAAVQAADTVARSSQPKHAAAEAAAEAAMGAGQVAALAAAAAAEPAGAAVWGEGRVRSVRQYEAWSGVNFRAMAVSEVAERGGMPSEACFWDRFASLEAMVEAREAGERG